MTTKNSVDVVEEVETIESEERRRRGKGCKAQVGDASTCATVEKINCCDNIVTDVRPIKMCIKEINNSILKGTVVEKCSRGGKGNAVKNAVVVATPCHGGSTNYVGLTDENGEYRICVPASDNCSKKYIIEAYYCGSCTGRRPYPRAEEE